MKGHIALPVHFGQETKRLGEPNDKVFAVHSEQEGRGEMRKEERKKGWRTGGGREGKRERRIQKVLVRCLWSLGEPDTAGGQGR